MGLISKRGEDDGESFADLSISGLEHLGSQTDESVFELDEWPSRVLAVLKERLETLAVPHEWDDDTTLVVATNDEAWVERIMDQVEDEQSLALDPDVGHVAYDLAAWDDVARDALFTVLEDEAVPHGMADDELFVHEIDEDRVDEIIDSVLDPGAPLPEGSGVDADVMGDLFVAGDRLSHDPGDNEGTLMLIDALQAAASGSAAPYGMDKVWWDSVLDKGHALVGMIDVPEPDADAISAAAVELRDGLRPYV